MKKLIEKYYLSSFYIITLAFSMVLLTLHFVFKEIGKYSVSFTQFAPAFAVLFLVLILKDQSILLEIKSDSLWIHQFLSGLYLLSRFQA